MDSKGYRMVNAYVAIDVETTGLNPKKEKIIEIGALRVREGKVEEEFHRFVHPRRALDERIAALTKITDDMVKDSPGIEEIIGEVVEFCQDLPILGHQVMFDYRFLKRAAVNQGIEWEREGIDTLKLCRIFMPEGESKALPQACRYYQVDMGDNHRALSDAYGAHALYQELVRRYQDKEPQRFCAVRLNYKVKREQPASKRQKERLQELLKYHKIKSPVQIGHLTRNEASRLTDEAISKYGRIGERAGGRDVREVRKAPGSGGLKH